jgi:hypothetical protein
MSAKIVRKSRVPKKRNTTTYIFLEDLAVPVARCDKYVAGLDRNVLHNTAAPFDVDAEWRRTKRRLRQLHEKDAQG